MYYSFGKFLSNVAVEKKFHLEHVGKFKNSVYHWTIDLDFWHTGTNLGVKSRKGVGPNFLSSGASILPIKQLKNIKSQELNFGDVIHV